MIEFEVTYGGFRAWLTEMATKKPRGIAGTCNSIYGCPIANYINLFMPPEVTQIAADGRYLKGLAYYRDDDSPCPIKQTLWEQETPRWARQFMQKVDARRSPSARITYKTALDCLNWAANDMERYYPKGWS